ncbi:N-terminal glutamine amidase-domain-containing protein [Peziza echinospora]|nr:N-terminal glutamine amidase-domain-containing protein [Peziza echinospora]
MSINPEPRPHVPPIATARTETILLPGPSTGPGLSRESFTYTPYYCEENIYLLVRDHIPPEKLGEYTVVFISNPDRIIPLYSPRTTPNPLIFWDYHVILIHHPATTSSTVYDFDTSLHPPFPIPIKMYVATTLFGGGSISTATHARLGIPSHLRRFYRCIPAEQYRLWFASGRGHMVEGGAEAVAGGVERPVIWKAPPPSYPAISPSIGVSLGLNMRLILDPNIENGDIDVDIQPVYGTPTPENTFPAYLDFSSTSARHGKENENEQDDDDDDDDGPPRPFGVILGEEEFLERFLGRPCGGEQE